MALDQGYMLAKIYPIWPALKEYQNIIHMINIDLSFDAEPQIQDRHPETIAKQLRDANAMGKTKFIFFQFYNGIVPQVTTIIQHITTLVEDIIDSKDIFYASASPNSQEVYDKLFVKHQYKNKISILGSLSCQLFAQNNCSAHESKLDNYEIKEKSKDFLCFNKESREHRVRLLELMLSSNYDKSGYYSFHGSESWERMLPLLNSEFTHVKKNAHRIPITLNITDNQSNLLHIRDDDLKYFADSYYSIVTETMFYDNTKGRFTNLAIDPDCVSISEKTFKCFPMLHPFIVLGRPGILKELKRIGYKTFSPMIDETYDSIQNDEERLNAIWKEISRLRENNKSDWLQWQSNIKNIVEHNKQHFYVNKNYGETKNIEKYFI